jgi:segregation and condensation protein B
MSAEDDTGFDTGIDKGFGTDDIGAPGAPVGTGLNVLSMFTPPVIQVVEGALMAAGGPLTLDQILGLYPDEQRPAREEIRDAVAAITEDYQGRGIELVEVAGGWRIQVRREVAPWVGRLWEEKPARYSRALLETLALIAYRQPITRGEIEDIRGVAVSTQIVKTLSERDWIRIVGHRDVPGRPALFATTRRFLDYFGLRSLNDLPSLAEIRDPSFFADALDLGGSEAVSADAADESDDGKLLAQVQIVAASESESDPDPDPIPIPSPSPTRTRTRRSRRGLSRPIQRQALTARAL